MRDRIENDLVSGQIAKMCVNTEIVDCWRSEGSLLVHFCGFLDPQFIGKSYESSSVGPWICLIILCMQAAELPKLYCGKLCCC